MQMLNVERAKQLYNQIDKYEDAGYGCCILALPKIQQIVVSSLDYIADNNASVFAYVIMPNHVHLLIQPESKSLSEIGTSFKQVTGHAINRELNREGDVWEREYFDRFLRDSEHFRRCVRYIRKNYDSMKDRSLLWVRDDFDYEKGIVPDCVRYHDGTLATIAGEWKNHRRLNHYDEVGICQFVTLRLSDAVPSEVIMQWKQELGIARNQ